MKKIFLYAIAVILFAGVFNACTSKTSKTEEEQRYSVSAADSSAMVNEVAEILTLMQNDDYAAAIDRLYTFNPTDSTLTPLDEQGRTDLQFRAQVFPVKSFKLYSTGFDNEWTNTVTFDVAFGEADAEGNAPMTKMGFNIISKDGKFYPTILDKRM